MINLNLNTEPTVESAPSNVTPTKTIADYAITYKMSVTCFNPTKQSASVKSASAAKYNCKASKFTGTIHMIDEEFTHALTSKVREIRRFFDTNTLRLSMSNIIPSGNFWRVSDYVTKEGDKFDILKDDFCARWESEIKPKSLQNLGALAYDPQIVKMAMWSYTEDQLRERIYFEFGKGTMGDPSTVANLSGLTEDLKAGIEEDMRKELAELDKEATAEVTRRLRKVLQDFVTKFKGLKENSRLHDSILTNIGDIASMIPSLIVNDDPTLIELASEASLLANWDASILKENEGARKEALTTAQSILNKMSL